IAALTFLMLVFGDVYKIKLITMAGPRLADRRITADLIRSIDKQIERYLSVRVLISAIVAGATALGLVFVGLSNALIWGLISGALNIVPFLGPATAILLITLAAFVQFKTFALAGAAFLVSTLVAAAEGNALTPWLTSRAGEINIVAAFVSVLFWGWLWG